MTKFGPYGGNGGGPSVIAGRLLQSFFGRAGAAIDNIGVRGQPY